MYKDCKSVKADLIVALLWAQISKNNTVGTASAISKDLISLVKSQLSDAEMALADGLAHKCILSGYRICG
jgi:hypothetical protein